MLSIILPNWNPTLNHARGTEECIARLRVHARVPTQLIYIDNASPFKVQDRGDLHHTNMENVGICRAFNQGLSIATGDYITFIGASVRVEPGWDEELMRCASEGHIAFPYTDMGEGYKRPDTAGVAGWCNMMSRHTQLRVGWFDEMFAPTFYEDTDFWHRAWLLEIPLTPCPKAKVRYQRRKTSGSLPNWELLFLANRLKYSWKWQLDPNIPPPFYSREVKDYEG
jgi:GT2 family glycosyltransferase